MRIPHLDTQQFEIVRLLFSIGLTVLVCVGSLLTIRYLIGSPLELNARPAPRTPIGAPTIRGHKTKARPPSLSSKTQGSAAAKPKNADAVQPTNQGLDNEDAASRPLRAAGPLTYFGEGDLGRWVHNRENPSFPAGEKSGPSRSCAEVQISASPTRSRAVRSARARPCLVRRISAHQTGRDAARDS